MKTKRHGSFKLPCVLVATIQCCVSIFTDRARDDYYAGRFSTLHHSSKASCPIFNETRDFVWTKGELRSDGYMYGVEEADGLYHYELRYNPAPDVLRWVEEMDRNYILQLKREGKLLEKEPIGDQEIKAAEDTPADKDGWGHRHQFHDEIFATFAAAREEVKQFGKELSEKERQEQEKQAREKLEREKLEREKLEREKLEREKLEREKQAREATTTIAQLRQEMQTHCSCAKSGKIMLDPVIASDGETYEREEIEEWYLTHDTSPKTGEVQSDKRLLPNKAMASLRASLLKLYPELLTSDQLYFSKRLQHQLLQAVQDGDLDRITACITLDERLLTYPLVDTKPLLICALESRRLPIFTAVLEKLGARF